MAACHCHSELSCKAALYLGSSKHAWKGKSNDVMSADRGANNCVDLKRKQRDSIYDQSAKAAMRIAAATGFLCILHST
jgi:hypothetical protein